MPSPTEVKYEPIDCSDVTVHFGNKSFHLHSVILKKESKVLGAAVDGANDGCNLTEACKKPGHRCFSLTSPFGAIVVADNTMKAFFNHMYDPADRLHTSKSLLNWGSKLRTFLNWGDIVRLSHYFDCGKLAQSHKFLISECLAESEKCNKNDMFELLMLCDHCHFDSEISDIITLLRSKKMSFEPDQCKSVVLTCRNETVTSLLQGAFS